MSAMTPPVAPERWCDAGICRAKKANGEACLAGAGSACASGNCVASGTGTGPICCGVTCSGATPACNAAGTGCACGASSCGSARVCYQGACCTPNACDQCSSVPCVRGCGLPDVAWDCAGTATSCCGTTCCRNYDICCSPGNCRSMGQGC